MIRLALAGAMILAACDPARDIVAYEASDAQVDAGSDAGLDVEDANVAEVAAEHVPPLVTCDPLAASFLFVLTKGGYSFFEPGGWKVLGRSTSCPLSGVAGMAVQADSSVWLVDTDGGLYVEPPSQPCKPVLLKPLLATPAFITFVFLGGVETLYAATGDGMLVTIDLQSFTISPVGPFKPGAPLLGLMGTGDGRLEAMIVQPAPQVLIYTASPANGMIVSKTFFNLNGAEAPLGGGAWGKDLYVLSAQTAYDFQVASQQVVGTSAVPPTIVPPILGIASSPCASQAK